MNAGTKISYELLVGADVEAGVYKFEPHISV
jgi:hypothetical protein